MDMTLNKSPYTTCTRCKALNMSHRVSCYRCNNPMTPTLRRVKPESMLPPDIKEDRRQHRRLDVNAKGAVIGSVGNVIYGIIIKNISSGGMLFDSEQETIFGETLSLRIELAGATFEVEGVVRHTGRLLASELPYASGVEFIKANKDLNKLLDTMYLWSDQFD